MRLLLGTGGTKTEIEEEEEEGGIAIREGGTTMTTGEEEADRGIWTTTDRGIEIRRGGGRGARITSVGRRLAGTSIRGGVSSVCARFICIFALRSWKCTMSDFLAVCVC